MIAEEHTEVFIVVLELESNMLPSLPAIDVRCTKGRSLTEPLTDAVNTQELVELSFSVL